MSKSVEAFAGLIDSTALREELTALTARSDGDGSDPAIRTQVLGRLKEAMRSARKIVEESDLPHWVVGLAL